MPIDPNIVPASGEERTQQRIGDLERGVAGLLRGSRGEDQVISVVPTAASHPGPDGTTLFYSSGGTYRMYVMIGGAYRTVALT